MEKNKLIWRIGFFNEGSYAEEDLHLLNDEFEEIHAREYLYDVPDQWDSLSRFRVPKQLSSDSAKHGGVEKLSFRFNLPLGVYLFKFACSEGVEKNYCLVLLDGQEIASFTNPSCKQVQQGGLRLPFAKKAKVDTHEYLCPFVCPDDGMHTLTIETKNIPLKNAPKSYLKVVDERPWAGKDLVVGSSYQIDAFELREYTPHHTPSLLKEHPGRVYLDTWGWQSCISYMREKKLGEHREVNLEYMKKRAIDESYKWGANSLEVYPFPLSMSWHKNDPIEGAEVYESHDSLYWNDETYKELTQYAHLRDMMIHWFIHSLGECAPSLRAMRLEDEVMPLHFNFVQKLARDFSNPLKEGWRESLDGYGQETGYMLGDFAALALTQRGWMYNPGMYQFESTASFRIYPTFTPAISPCFLDYCMTSFSFMGGRDDKFPVAAYGDDYLHSRYGKVYQTYQSSARARSRLDGRHGGAYPDWVLKQCNDFFRERASNPSDIHATAIWWLVEEDFYLKGNRPYVQGISQDPIKCAVATDLRTTGAGGCIDKLHFIRHKVSVIDGLGSLVTRNRCPFPRDASFIQNNYFRLYIDSKEDHVALFYDLEGLAHYDDNSLSIKITEDLIKTTPQNELSAEKIGFGCQYPEPAGYRAILKEEAGLKVGKSKLKEIRSYQVDNDTPYFKISLDREWIDAPQTLDTHLGCPGYDKLIVEDTVYTDKAKLNDISILYLESTQSLKPDLAILLLRKGNIGSIVWHPSSHLIFKSAPVRKEIVELGIGFPRGLYTQDDLKLLHNYLMEEEKPLAIEYAPQIVRNELPIPLVKVVKINEAPSFPYLVEEYGWWMFRGAQVSQQDSDLDYLKIYLPAHGEATIMPYGFIEDAVKPGWGCQYTVALQDIMARNDTLGCRVKVLSVTPLIFAPRLQFKKKISSAKLDGKSWHYFDEDLVFLPNQEGIYQVEVNTEKEVLPHITRTFALVKKTSWDKKTLTLKTALPVWSKKVPDDFEFTAILDTADYEVGRIVGGTIASSENDKLLFKFRPGDVRIIFRGSGR